MDIEWLLSTLFDASLLSTFEPPETAALFVPFRIIKINASASAVTILKALWQAP